MTSKKIQHMELQENLVWEWVQEKVLNVLHVKGRVNTADIFTKEMRDGANFRRLRDSFMCRLSDFVQQSLLVIHHSHSTPQPVPHLVVPSVASSQTFSTHFLFFGIMFLSPLSDTFSRFPFVKCGSSPFAAPSSYSHLGITLRSGFIRLR
jgi:hypothetical protein